MAERLKFKCWNCPETYSLLRNPADGRILLVKCPFCDAEAEVDLKPWETHVVETTRSSDSSAESMEKTLNLPDVLPTTPRQ